MLCLMKLNGCLSLLNILPWLSLFTQPNITHFEDKNRRPDFQKIICTKIVGFSVNVQRF